MSSDNGSNAVDTRGPVEEILDYFEEKLKKNRGTIQSPSSEEDKKGNSVQICC